MTATQVTEKNLHSRNRNVQSEYRKQQLIQATLECIEKFGLSQTTLANIAKAAGISQGNVVFHFQSKENLLAQALQSLSREYMACWQSALAEAAGDPVNQLCAMIQAPFKASVCSRKKISVWYAFWSESRSRPKYMQICGDQDRAYSAALLDICQQLEAISQSALSASAAALSIESMVDGLLQNFLIDQPVGFKRTEAVATLFEMIKVIYPNLARNIDSAQKVGKI